MVHIFYMLFMINCRYSREWRYHMEEKVWITQAPGCGVIEKTSTYERGTYYFFDAQNWRKVAKEFYLDYSKLENQPSMPTLYHSVWQAVVLSPVFVKVIKNVSSQSEGHRARMVLRTLPTSTYHRRRKSPSQYYEAKQNYILYIKVTVTL